MRMIDDAWQEFSVGKTTAVVGARLPAPPDDSWHVERFSARPGDDDGALIERATFALEAELRPSLLARASQEIALRLRKRLFGAATTSPVALLVELMARYAEEVEKPLALVFDGLEAADAHSIAVLDELVSYPGRFGAAIVLVFESMAAAADSPAASLLASVRRVEGPDGLLGVNQGPETWAELQPVAFSSDEDVEPRPVRQIGR